MGAGATGKIRFLFTFLAGSSMLFAPLRSIVLILQGLNALDNISYERGRKKSHISLVKCRQTKCG
jgi:hypothetical protein